MHCGGVIQASVADGKGFRTVVFFSGCEHHCKGCHNKDSWDRNYGIEFTVEDLFKNLYPLLNKEYIQGLTLSGGDPLMSYNYPEALKLAKKVKEEFPNKDIWCYTGYTYDKVKDLEIMKYIDVLVDGTYKKELHDARLAFKGSSNQNIIYLNK